MKPGFLAHSLCLLTGLTLFFTFCQKKQERLPLVTSSVASAGVDEASFSGVLYSEGDSKLIEKGICWSVNPNVTVEDDKVICMTEEQNFTGLITNLIPGTHYYGRVYARNDFGISYGKVISFFTLQQSFPNLTLGLNATPGTTTVSLLFRASQTTPIAFTAGFCWSKTNPMPSVADASVQLVDKSKSSPVPYAQDFPYTIENLTKSTTYYARTFCKIGSQITYGNQTQWTTATPAPTINPLTFSVRGVGQTTAVCDFTVANISTTLVQATGVCWSENANPTISDFATEMQGYKASGNLLLDGLNANTSYYVRAYVKTSTEVLYGKADLVIRTFKGTMMDVNGNVYNTVEIGGVEWMASNYRATKFNNGTAISQLTIDNYNLFANNLNAQTAFFCYYAVNSSYDVPYGKLYPRSVAKNANLPPAGWRLPTQEEWESLVTNCEGVANLCVKDGSWKTAPVTNAYGFSLYPAGYWDSGFGGMGSATAFWIFGTDYATYNFTSYTLSGASSDNGVYSVRFVKN